MLENSTEKKRLFYLIVLFLTFVVMIVGATFAYLQLVASGKKEGTVLYTGTVQVNYIDGTYVDNPELFPMKSVNYDTYDNVYRNNFAITSTGTLDQTLVIDLNVRKNDFGTNLKYVLYNNSGNELSKGDVPITGVVNLASNMFLEHGKTTRYTLLVWLKDSGNNQYNGEEKTFSAKIDVTAIQIKN